MLHATPSLEAEICQRDLETTRQFLGAAKQGLEGGEVQVDEDVVEQQMGREYLQKRGWKELPLNEGEVLARVRKDVRWSGGRGMRDRDEEKRLVARGRGGEPGGASSLQSRSKGWNSLLEGEGGETHG
jgi:hypothetical protein